jgi:hypothetical protein
MKPVRVDTCLISKFDGERAVDSTALQVESIKADSPSPTTDTEMEGSPSENTVAFDASSATGTRPFVDDETTVVRGRMGGREAVGGGRKAVAFAEHLKPWKKHFIMVNTNPQIV